LCILGSPRLPPLVFSLPEVASLEELLLLEELLGLLIVELEILESYPDSSNTSDWLAGCLGGVLLVLEVLGGEWRLPATFSLVDVVFFFLEM
jgi:hypothetical protein